MRRLGRRRRSRRASRSTGRRAPPRAAARARPRRRRAARTAGTGRAGTAHVRPLVPVEPEPAQLLEDPGLEPRPDPRPVEVLDAHGVAARPRRARRARRAGRCARCRGGAVPSATGRTGRGRTSREPRKVPCRMGARPDIPVPSARSSPKLEGEADPDHGTSPCPDRPASSSRSSPLRSSADWGVGEIPDLVPLARWCASAGFSVAQVLPVNEASRGQNSPYAALSAFAVDPVYVGVDALEDFEAAGGVSRALAARTRRSSRRSGRRRTSAGTTCGR